MTTPISNVIEPPPRSTGRPEVDGVSALQYLWALYTKGILNGALLQTANFSIPLSEQFAAQLAADFPTLAALEALAGAADKLAYYTAAQTLALTGLSAFARTLIDDVDAATARTTLGVTIYTDELAQDAVGGILTDTATIDFTYDDVGAQITADVKDGSITYAKMQDVSATDIVLGRSSLGAGDVEEIACTAAGRAILDDANASAQRTTLGLGTMATQAASNVAITGGSIIIAAGTGSIMFSDNGATAAANDLYLAANGNYHSVTGNTRIDRLQKSDWQSGSVLYLRFTGTPTVTNGAAVSGDYKPINLAGAVDFVASANDVLALLYDGTNSAWYEVSRSVN